MAHIHLRHAVSGRLLSSALTCRTISAFNTYTDIFSQHTLSATYFKYHQCRYKVDKVRLEKKKQKKEQLHAIELAKPTLFPVSSVFAEVSQGVEEEAAKSTVEPEEQDNEDVNILDELRELNQEDPFEVVENSKGQALQVKRYFFERMSADERDEFEQRIATLAKLATTTHYADRFGDAVELVGTPDPNVPVSDTPCPGCGATLHCQDPNVPGYLPSESYLHIAPEKLPRTLCQRCVLLKDHKMALNVGVTPQLYTDVIKQLRERKGLIIMLVDICDLPSSIYRALPSLIGQHRDIYVVANKVDLLPKDSKEYLERTLDCLDWYMGRMGFKEQFNIRHMALVSAKTKFGIEQLISTLLTDWADKGDVYVVGCTNVGKSTLFNALISSDYCRSGSRDLITKATTSVWPGCTLNLLKFPITRPKGRFLQERGARLRKEQQQQREKIIDERNEVQSWSDHEKATLKGHVGVTTIGRKEFTVAQLQEQDPIELASYDLSRQADEHEAEILEKRRQRKEKVERILIEYDEDARLHANFCHDTPGVINPDQITTLLTQEELQMLLSNSLLKPRTYKLRPGNCLFVAGLARVDLLESRQPVLFTVFCSKSLPVIEVPNCSTADDFYIKNIGTQKLKVPKGDRERCDRLPSLVGKEFTLLGTGRDSYAADITLSSIGWVSVAAHHRDLVRVRAYTVSGGGLYSRPPLLLNAVSLRGRRVGSTFRLTKPMI